MSFDDLVNAARDGRRDEGARAAAAAERREQQKDAGRQQLRALLGEALRVLRDRGGYRALDVRMKMPGNPDFPPTLTVERSAFVFGERWVLLDDGSVLTTKPFDSSPARGSRGAPYEQRKALEDALSAEHGGAELRTFGSEMSWSMEEPTGYNEEGSYVLDDGALVLGEGDTGGLHSPAREAIAFKVGRALR